MRFQLLADIASRTTAASYEHEAEFRHRQRQQFMAEEIAGLSPIKRILVAAEELIQEAT